MGSSMTMASPLLPAGVSCWPSLPRLFRLPTQISRAIPTGPLGSGRPTPRWPLAIFVHPAVPVVGRVVNERRCSALDVRTKLQPRRRRHLGLHASGPTGPDGRLPAIEADLGQSDQAHSGLKPEVKPLPLRLWAGKVRAPPARSSPGDGDTKHAAPARTEHMPMTYQVCSDETGREEIPLP